tara:strand:+ start:862 stop:1062 length:201 start_codon:yes stop_codon:yes gene_type:complete
MTVQQLIEKLQSLNPDDQIIIEENHGVLYHISEKRITEEMIEEDGGFLHHASEEDLVAKKMVVIQL